jgi:hypothetical protein
MNFFMRAVGGVNFVEPVAPDADIVLKFNLYELSSMFQERSISPSGVPVTPVAGVGQPVGFIHDQSRACLFMRGFGATTIPQFTVDGLSFDGVNDMMEIPSSTGYIKPLHAVGSVWSIRFWLKCNLNGNARPLINWQGLSATQSGAYIQRTAANQVRIFIGDGTAPPIVDYTSTKTIVAADGAVPVQIIINGANSKMIIGSTTETFTASITEGSVNPATQNVRLGGDGSSFFNGSFSRDIKIVNRVWTAQEIADYQVFNPANTTADFTPILKHDYDPNDNTTVFTDAAETTPAVNNGVVRSIKNKVTVPFSPITRKGTSAADAAAPILKTNQVNGKSVLEFDGTGNKLVTWAEDLGVELGGCMTWVFVLQNRDANFGSEWVNANPEYCAWTGSQYPGAYGAGKPYVMPHHGGGIGPDVFTSTTDAPNIIILERFGAEALSMNQAKVVNSISTFGKFNWISTGQAAPAGVPNWHPDGYLIRVKVYIGRFSLAQKNALIDNLKTQYGISGTL